MENNVSRGFIKEGTPFIWLSGFTVLILLGMLVGLVGLIFAKGVGHFWPAELARIEMKNGTVIMGKIMAHQTITMDGKSREKTQLKIANRDIYSLDFRWIEDENILKITMPENGVVIERMEYGDFHGYITSIEDDGKSSSYGDENFSQQLEAGIEKAEALEAEVEETVTNLQKANKPVHELDSQIQSFGEPSILSPEKTKELQAVTKQRDETAATLADEIDPLKEKLSSMRQELAGLKLQLRAETGETVNLQLSEVVRVYHPNNMSTFAKAWHYIGKVCEFLWADPRESNTEGGIFPAIYGTVLLVMIMVVTATPLGVLTALYMHEYAKPGPLLNIIRLSVNNLAGVPSIVFGIFGLGFFIYFVGGGIDKLFFADALPAPTFGTGGILWASLTLALLTVPVVVVATEEGLSSVPRANRDGALALGASKFQTIIKIVLPNAAPGILTGVILAISRGAGEVAPLMITGVVKLAGSLPMDGDFPYLHLDRKFMHLGFHIFDVGFQSPNVEAAKPMVYTTTLLLLVIVLVLNMFAIYLRNRLREKYKGSAI